MLLQLRSNVKVQQTRREKIAVKSFLAGFSPEFEEAKSQILSSSKIPSLKDVFTRMLRTKNTLSSQPLVL